MNQPVAGSTPRAAAARRISPGCGFRQSQSIAYSLIPSNDPAALADRIARIVGDPATRLRLSAQAIRRANELFTWRQVTHQIAAIYDEIGAVRSVRHDRLATIRLAGKAALEPARSGTRQGTKRAIQAGVR